MKLTHIALLLLATVSVAFAADAPSAPAPYKPTPIQAIALDLAKSTTTGDAALSAELKKLGIEAGKKHDEVVALVKAMRALTSEGVVAGSAAFWALLGSGAPATARGGDEPAAPNRAATAAEQLWRRGLARLSDIPRAQRDVFLDYNLVDQTEDVEGWRTGLFGGLLQEGAEPSKVTFGLLNQPRSPFSESTRDRVLEELNLSPAQKVQMAKNLRKADSLLVRLGFNAIVENEKTGGPAPTEDQRAAVTTNGLAAVDTPPALNPDARLRNAGISFAVGAGIIRNEVLGEDGVPDHQDKTISVVMARWNLIQRKATAKWNQRVGRSNPDGYSLVTHYGRTEYALPNYFARDRPYPRRLEKTGFLHDVVTNVTFFGPLFGTAALGEEILRPGTQTGEKERPYLVGWSLGLGFFDEASSLIYFDVGKTVSPRRGFDDSRLYYGFSCDAVVFQKLIEGTRKATTDLKL